MRALVVSLSTDTAIPLCIAGQSGNRVSRDIRTVTCQPGDRVARADRGGQEGAYSPRHYGCVLRALVGFPRRSVAVRAKALASPRVHTLQRANAHGDQHEL